MRDRGVNVSMHELGAPSTFYIGVIPFVFQLTLSPPRGASVKRELHTRRCYNSRYACLRRGRDSLRLSLSGLHCQEGVGIACRIEQWSLLSLSAEERNHAGTFLCCEGSWRLLYLQHPSWLPGRASEGVPEWFPVGHGESPALTISPASGLVLLCLLLLCERTLTPPYLPASSP